jgi:hypothetical protein
MFNQIFTNLIHVLVVLSCELGRSCLKRHNFFFKKQLEIAHASLWKYSSKAYMTQMLTQLLSYIKVKALLGLI